MKRGLKLLVRGLAFYILSFFLSVSPSPSLSFSYIDSWE